MQLMSTIGKFTIMVGRVGYAPTTPAMSMQYSTIELIPHLNNKLIFQFFISNQFFENIFVFSLIEYIKDKLRKKKVRLRSPKNAPLGKNGINEVVKKIKQPNCK